MPLLQKYYKVLQKYYFYITEYCRLLYAEIYKGRKPKFSPFIVLILTVLQEWEEISFSAFSKARRNGCFTGRFFVETVKMFRDEDDRIIMECSRKDFEKYQQEDRHSRYLQEHEKSRSIFPASHVGDRDGTEEGYQDTDLFVDESVDTAEQAIQNLLLEDLHQALLKLSPAERDFILSYYEMKIPNATCLAQRYGITRQAADKRLKKIEEKIKKLVAIF